MDLDTSDLDLVTDSPNPLDAVEVVLSSNDLAYTRIDDDEISVAVDGLSDKYLVSLVWQDEYEALQLSCQIPIALPDTRLSAIAHLLMQANSKVWLGHFEMAEGDSRLQFRHTSMMRGPLPGSGLDYLNDLFRLAVSECDRFLPALRMILDDDMVGAADLAFALQEPVGES